MSDIGFEQLNELMRAYRKTNVLFAAHELGVLDKISNQSIKSEDLTADLNLSAKGLERLLSALCAMGIIIKKDKSYKISTKYKKFLDPESVSYIGGLLKHEIHLQKRWMQLSESIKSGLPVKKLDEPVNPEDTNRFIHAMANIGQRTAPLMLDKIHFNGTEHLMDLGGGPGKYVEKFCDRYPAMKVTLFDQVETVSAAKKSLSKHKYFKNMHFIQGDFLKDNLGQGYDVIFSSNVIHIFGPDEIQIIFDKCYQALRPSGRLLIKDFFLNEQYTGPEFATLFSIHMLLSTENGRCYSEKEIITLMEGSKFAHGQTVNLTESSIVIEGIK